MKRPRKDRVMNTKLVLRSKKDERGRICKHTARLVVCRNEEVDIQEETFSPVTDHSIIKLVLYLCIKQRWKVQHLDLQIASANGHLGRSALA